MRIVTLTLPIALALAACEKRDTPPPQAEIPAAAAPRAPEAELQPLDPTNIVSIASASKDHSTLVAALKAADYVTVVAATGPFTVFAPTNAAFEKLPAGTVEGLLKPEKLEELRNILKYHVTTSVYEVGALKDGMTLGMANGGKVSIRVTDGKVFVNDVPVVASVRGSNGIIHVIDGVLLPPQS